jgi:hypothetical protein
VGFKSVDVLKGKLLLLSCNPEEQKFNKKKPVGSEKKDKKTSEAYP